MQIQTSQVNIATPADVYRAVRAFLDRQTARSAPSSSSIETAAIAAGQIRRGRTRRSHRNKPSSNGGAGYFRDGLRNGFLGPHLRAYKGTWAVTDRLTHSAAVAGTNLLLTRSATFAGGATVNVQVLGTTGVAGVVLCGTATPGADDLSGYAIIVDVPGEGFSFVRYDGGTIATTFGVGTPIPAFPFTLTLTRGTGTKLFAYINGNSIASPNDATYYTGRAGLICDATAGSTFRALSVLPQ